MKSENRVHITSISHGQQWNDISEHHQLSAVYELPLDSSVEYYDNKNTENLERYKVPAEIIVSDKINYSNRFKKSLQ